LAEQPKLAGIEKDAHESAILNPSEQTRIRRQKRTHMELNGTPSQGGTSIPTTTDSVDLIFECFHRKMLREEAALAATLVILYFYII
jgi:hypothetical protein